MAKVIVPKLKKGDLVTLNSKGVEHFSNKQKRLITLSLAYPSRDKFDMVGIVVQSAYDADGRLSGETYRIAVGVAWCEEPSKITKIPVKWLKKVYHH
tara:strand:+ start:8024 stop:8314 length:291 start_codon:yes stop_codon:yes gene_type:complete